MTTYYYYSLAADFVNHLLNEDKLILEIAAVPSLATYTVSDCGRDDDNVRIGFTQPLSNADKTTLDSVVAAHQGISYAARSLASTLIPRVNAFNTTSYLRVASFEYAGTLSMKPIYSISALCYRDPAVTNYSIRAVNTTAIPPTILTEATFTNTTETMVTLTSIANLPLTNATIEIQIKKTGGPTNKYVYIDNITVYT